MTTLLSGVLVAACSRGTSIELRGQVLAVDPRRQEMTIKHEDIRGFMPGMTMPFKVSRSAAPDGIVAGDLVQATLRRRGLERLSDGRRLEPDTAQLTEAPPPPRDVEPARRRAPRSPTFRSSTRPARRACLPMARQGRRRHVHIHALSAAGLLSADGSALRQQCSASS